MSGPDNIFIGDNDMGTNLPEAVVNEEALVEEKKKARYSKTAEFKRIREWCEAKIAYHQSFLPGNVPVSMVAAEERGKHWAVADLVITDLTELMNMYDTAVDAVKENNGLQT